MCVAVGMGGPWALIKKKIKKLKSTILVWKSNNFSNLKKNTHTCTRTKHKILFFHIWKYVITTYC